MGNAEHNRCAFCGEDTIVSRQYLHAKNKQKGTNGFTFIYHCEKCGLAESISNPTTTTELTQMRLKAVEEIGIASFGGVAFEPTPEYRDKILPILDTLIQHAVEAAREAEREKAHEFVAAYKEKYRGCGMADSMLALDELLEALTPTPEQGESNNN